MCDVEKCERHELWGGLCLDHLKEKLGVDQKKKRTTKKVDAVELEVRKDDEDK